MNRPICNSATCRLADLNIPEPKVLLDNLTKLAEESDAGNRAMQAIESGVFTDKAGRLDKLALPTEREQLALLAWLAEKCESPLSVEVGFGMGISGCIILAARTLNELPFNHLIYDPFGIAGNHGAVIQGYLEEEFGDSFQRMHVRSQFGIGELVQADHRPECDLIFVDGDHHFEGVMADFFAADQLVRIGGMLVFDDADFPAVETVINFVCSNRPDYQVVVGEVKNTAILKKIDTDKRSWDHFTPFSVPVRSNWASKS